MYVDIRAAFDAVFILAAIPKSANLTGSLLERKDKRQNAA